VTSEHRVVIAVDHSDASAPAARMGARLCRELGAPVTLTYAVEPPSSTLLEVEDERLHNAQVSWAEEQLTELVESSFADLSVEKKVVDSGQPVPESICSVAIQKRASLIVMGTLGRSAFDQAVFGSTATTVIRHAPCDVLVVPPTVKEGALRKIVCAIDFSEGSKVALERASMLCRHFPAEIHAIHVVQMPFWPLQEVTPTAEVVARAEKALEEFLESARVDSPHAYVARGTPARKILELVDQLEADLVMVGTRGFTGIKRWAIGSVAERITRTAKLPVWCAR
jgi:nucleotide-binding universal stress UspA family protein